MFFGTLSIFLRTGPLQLLRKAAGSLGGDCALCGARCDEAIVCAACAAALPRAPVACPRCALPMAIPETCGRCLRHPPAFDSALAALEGRDRTLEGLLHHRRHSTSGSVAGHAQF